MVRIEKFSHYKLQKIFIQFIADFKDYTTDAEMVEEYAVCGYQTMLPIILHPCEDINVYWLVDGSHGTQACLKQDRTTIRTFVGFLTQ